MINKLFKLTWLVMALTLVSCASEKESVTKGQADIEYNILLKGGEKNISYVNQARPVLEKRCIVCHGCYDAPCQLKLTSIEGIKRGANPRKIYDISLVSSSAPTRMFVDAKSEEEWRKKGFHSVLNEQKNIAIDNLRQSVLYKMLRLKQLNPQPRFGMINDKFDLSLNRKQSCPTNDKFTGYAEKFPDQGMPFAMPNLTDDEYHILVKWISQGLPDDSNNELPESTKKQINKWEAFFNKNDLKQQLVSRYIYEHLFLGHIHFKGADNREFFRLVRSLTPTGEPIDEVSAIRPYDHPEADKFYYRLRYVKSSIVDKTHTVYDLSDKRMSRYIALFIKPDYEVKKLPSYELKLASNPIKTFTDIPVNSRYRFLLDDAQFFINGFIKGPVCRGQVALNVIEDHFWVFFINPEHFRVNRDNELLSSMVDDFNLPSEQGDTLNVFSTWTNYWNLQRNYMLNRQNRFIDFPEMNIDKALAYVWDGQDGMDSNNNALTIFRHFDSATVKQGMLGDYPESAWLIDYPVLERIHYLLVAGYNVNGNVGHQFNTRIYMDFLRMEAENTFLTFMPVKYRSKIRDEWYQGIREQLKKYFKEPEEWMNVQVVNGFKTDDPKKELFQYLEKRLVNTKHKKDLINRCNDQKCKSSNKLTAEKRHLQRIAKIHGEILVVLPDVSYLRVRSKGNDTVYTLINNKSYKNISSLFSDTNNRDKNSDSLTIYEGILGAYPNFFFVVDKAEIGDFADKMIAIRNRDDYERFVAIYGVRRTSSDFWVEADWFNEQSAKQNPIAYGIFDLNRYNNR
jgi:Fatty acid cis/trans isomerase (CTI)